ncbi:MAG: glucokinase [Vicinamibacterales bacterium]
MILAGDVGATKTLIGVFNFASTRPVAIDVRSFVTAEFDSLASIIAAFFQGRQGMTSRVDGASFGVAGPVIDQSARMTNVPWDVSAGDLMKAFNLDRVRLLNDLEAMAYAVPILQPDELHALQKGRRQPDGNAVLIAAGTGLGQSLLHHVSGSFRPIPSEGGHADFAARTDRELDLVRFLRAAFGRVDLEMVVSGVGFSNLYRFTHDGASCAAPVAGDEAADDPARITRAALAGTCSRCMEALQMFVSAYGAAAGNLALVAVSTAGVYVGGGIAPKILPAMDSGSFMEAFLAKDPMRAMLQQMPVHVILNPRAALLGAAVYANEMM